MPTQEILRATGVTLEIGGRRLVNGLDLTLRSGELLAMTGPSGCGKTTLLRVLAGLDRPRAGSMLLHGEPPEHIGWPRYRRSVIFLHQQPVLLDGDLATNLRRPFQYHVDRAAFPNDLAQELLAAFGLAGYVNHAARDLSVGERQRVCLVRALLLRPRVLLLDEPAAALDVRAAERVRAVLRRESAERGLAAIVVTHNLEQAHEWCDRVLELSSDSGVDHDTDASG